MIAVNLPLLRAHPDPDYTTKKNFRVSPQTAHFLPPFPNSHTKGRAHNLSCAAMFRLANPLSRCSVQASSSDAPLCGNAPQGRESDERAMGGHKTRSYPRFRDGAARVVFFCSPPSSAGLGVKKRPCQILSSREQKESSARRGGWRRGRAAILGASAAAVWCVRGGGVDKTAGAVGELGGTELRAARRPLFSAPC